MIRILLVGTSSTVGGAEKTLYTLAALLDPARFKVVGCVSLKPPGFYSAKLDAAGFKTYSLNLKSLPGLKDIRRLREIVHETGPDVVHAVMFSAIQLCRIVKNQLPLPYKLISSPRVNYRSRSLATRLLDRFLKSKDDLLIAESRASRDYLIQKQGYSSDKVRVIYNGVDIAGWPVSRLERQQKRLELRLAAGETLIGTAGRLDEQKGHDTLIDAMAELKGRPLSCLILGEGPARKNLEACIRRHQLEKQVWLYGECSDMPAWLSALDIFVLPSRWEGLPNSLLEAMAMGLPVAASAVDGVLEIIRDKQNGLLFAPNKPRQLAALLRELAENPGLREKLSTAAKETVTDKFGLMGMMTAYEEAYTAVATSSSRVAPG